MKRDKTRLASLRDRDDNPSTWKPDRGTIEAWAADVSTFWTSSLWTLRFEDGQLAGTHDRTLALQVRQGQEVLRFRFLLVFLYDLLVSLYPQHSESAPKSVYEQLARIISISTSSDHTIEGLASQVKDWVSRGRRYYRLTESFGDGILVELPVDISPDA